MLPLSDRRVKYEMPLCCRKLGLFDIWRSAMTSAVLTAGLTFIVVAAQALSAVLVQADAPRGIVRAVEAIDPPQW